MTIRRGRDEQLAPDEYAPIALFDLVTKLTLTDGEDMHDLHSRLDPDRIAAILGITEHGRFGAREIESFGEKLFTNGTMGVDLVVVAPGTGFPPHVHPGHHLLLCVSGRGTFTLAEKVHEVYPGFLAMIEGSVPHAVGNPYDEPHVLLAFGSPHRELDAEDRMTLTDWHGMPLLVAEGGHVHDESHTHTHTH